MVVFANVSRIRTFIYVILVLLLINLAVLAYIYLRYIGDGSRPEVALVEDIREAPKLSTVPPASKKRSFIIDYEGNTFLKDGLPFKYIAGSLHYFRVPQVYWQDRLRKFRAAGLNAVTTYVEWSTHEPTPGNYVFSGDQDLELFIRLAQEEDLLVILRPGPYICAERDLGGLPPWLLMRYPNIELRTDDADYKAEVKKWFDILLSKMNKYLYGNGGPIIMVQVENEYGSYPVCNMAYKIWLRDLMRSYVKDAAVLFTTDGGADYFLACGVIPEVYATVDFGTGAKVDDAFSAMRRVSSKGPLVNSEFYPGWLSHWEEKMGRVNTTLILNMMTEMLERNASFNFYMFFGGTNFGFMNGANFDEVYVPQLTSYDYDAPLDEAGDPTPKYFAIRELIGKYVPLPKIPLPKPAPRAAYGNVPLKFVVSLFNYKSIPNTRTVVHQKPLTFEELQLSYGFVLYQTIIPENIADPSVLDVSGLSDRAIVYIGQEPVTILSRSRNIYKAPIMALPKSVLSLLVENQGRINFGKYLKDRKGLLEVPLINDVPLYSWQMTTFPFTNVSWVPTSAKSGVNHASGRERPPAVYYGELILPPNTVPANTFIDPTGWGKGNIFLNGFNLGRYWPSIGSQVTLFVPGCYLRAAPEINHVVVVELESAPREMSLNFVDKPYLDKIPPKIGN